MLTNGTFEEVNDPGKPSIAKAIGQFILVRKDSYCALGGHAAVRNEVVEDFEFARRAKRLGYRFILADGRHLVRTRGYRSLTEIWEGFGKNALREAKRLPGGAVIPLVGLPVVAVGPLVLVCVALRRLVRHARVMDAVLLFQAAAQAVQLLDAGRLSAVALGAPQIYGLA